LLHLAVSHYSAQSDGSCVLERNHDFQAAGFDLEEVKALDAGAYGSTADLLNYSDAMVGIDDLITDLEANNTVHEGHPWGERPRELHLVYSSMAKTSIRVSIALKFCSLAWA